MTIAFRSSGGFSSAFNANVTPAAPAGFQAGDLLVAHVGYSEGSGSNSGPPAGWARLYTRTNAVFLDVWGRIAVGSDAMPTVNFGSSTNSWACVVAYTGVLQNTGNAQDVSKDNLANTTTDIVGPPTMTPGGNNELALFCGFRKQTSSSQGETFTAPANYTLRAQYSPNTDFGCAICDWIQTTATATGANPHITGNKSDGTTQRTEGIITCLKPQTGVVLLQPRSPRIILANTWRH